MTALVDLAFSTVRALSPDRQDEVARVVLRLVGIDDVTYILNEDERRDLDEADLEIALGELASDAEVASLWSKPLPAP